MTNAETMISCIVESRLEARQSLAVEFKGGLLRPSFFYAIINKMKIHMDKGKLKLMVRNLELLVDSLKSEIYSDVDAYTNSKAFAGTKSYDAVHDDDDGYPD